MKLSQINEWLTLFANLGVLAGIIFLAIELQQNTESMQAQTRTEIATSQLWIYDKITSSDTAEIYQKGMGGELPVDSDEYQRFAALLRGMFNVWENEWYQYTNGMYTEDAFQPQIARWKAILSSPTARNVYAVSKNGYSSSFVSEMDALAQSLDN